MGASHHVDLEVLENDVTSAVTGLKEVWDPVAREV